MIGAILLFFTKMPGWVQALIEIAVVALIAWLIFLGAIAHGRAEEKAAEAPKLAKLQSDLAASDAKAAALAKQYAALDQLRQDEEAAHSAETARLISAVQSASHAKESIHAAPDANSAYHFSDGLYGLMRSGAAATAGSASSAADSPLVGQ